MAIILIVDDEQPIREVLALVLRADGHRILLAGNGQQALELVTEDRPDLVLADVMMPRLNGAKLCRRLKAEPTTASIPVILMSAAGQAVADGAGADAYLDKPFELHEVDRLVRRWLPPTPGLPSPGSEHR